MYIKLNLDIDMSIDEVIEHATADVEFYENQLESLKREGYVISDVATKQIYDGIRYNKSIVRLLEDLKMLRLNSSMIHMDERFKLVENGYNKAIDDFAKRLKARSIKVSTVKEHTYFKAVGTNEVDKIAEQLKAGRE